MKDKTRATKKASEAAERPSPRSPSVVFGIGILVLLGTGLLSAALAEKGIGKVALCAFFTEWMSGRAGVPWSDPAEPRPAGKTVALRIARALGLAAGIALASVLAGLAAGALTARGQTTSPEGLLFSFLSAAFSGMRAELTEHGLVFAMLFPLVHALPNTKRWYVLVLVGAAASLAGALGRGETGLMIAASGCVGALTSALWSVDKGAFRAVAVRGGLAFFLGSFVRLGPVAVMAGGKSALATSPEASVFVCLCALAALSLVRPGTHARSVGA